MWLLFLILTGHQDTLIAKYTTLTECTSEGVRILKEMEKAYPDDKGMDLECRKPRTIKA